MQFYEPACDGPVILFFEVVVCPRRPLRYLCFALIEIIITKDLDPNRIVDLHGHPERCLVEPRPRVRRHVPPGSILVPEATWTLQTRVRALDAGLELLRIEGRGMVPLHTEAISLGHRSRLAGGIRRAGRLAGVVGEALLVAARLARPLGILTESLFFGLQKL